MSLTAPEVPEPLIKVRVLKSRRLEYKKRLAVGDVVKVKQSQAHAWVANGWAEIVPVKAT